MNMITKGLFTSVALLATLASCGGVASGGAGGTGISQRPITGFGSVYVNGVQIEGTATTTTELEDVSGKSRVDLKVRMVVKVEWEKDAAVI